LEAEMARTLFGSLTRWPGGKRASRTFSRRRVLIPLLVVGLSVALSGSVLAVSPTVYTTVNKFTIVRHFDPYPPCNDFGGTTETATGTEHIHFTDLGDSVAVSYNETFWVTIVPDRPTEATYQQQGTDASILQLRKDGTVVHHESFHNSNVTFDNGATYVMLRFYTTFVYANGAVLVDHTFGANNPPDECS
jgi:hypothetical protein